MLLSKRCRIAFVKANPTGLIAAAMQLLQGSWALKTCFHVIQQPDLEEPRLSVVSSGVHGRNIATAICQIWA